MRGGAPADSDANFTSGVFPMSSSTESPSALRLALHRRYQAHSSTPTVPRERTEASAAGAVGTRVSADMGMVCTRARWNSILVWNSISSIEVMHRWCLGRNLRCNGRRL